MQQRCFYFFSLFPHYSLCILLLPLRHLRSSNLLPRRVHVANNKVLGDLLHVLIVEEGVEAQLVCGRGGEENKQGGRGRRGCNVIKYALAPGEDREGGAICPQVIDARTSRPSPPHRPIKCHAALHWL